MMKVILWFICHSTKRKGYKTRNRKDKKQKKKTEYKYEAMEDDRFLIHPFPYLYTNRVGNIKNIMEEDHEQETVTKDSNRKD